MADLTGAEAQVIADGFDDWFAERGLNATDAPEAFAAWLDAGMPDLPPVAMTRIDPEEPRRG